MINSWLRRLFMKLRGQGAEEQPERTDRKAPHANPDTFEQIYKAAAVKPPKIAYGIQKVADMAHSGHLEGMSPELKRRALLMALQAADTDESEVLNDLVIRQRALKEYEDAFQERVNLFEAGQLEQNRLRNEELAKITGQFKARIQANLDEVETRHREFRDWQENKRQLLHRFTEAAALCVPQEGTEPRESEPEIVSNVRPMLRPTGSFK